MRRVIDLYRTSVGKKVLMAVSGIFLVLFLVGHMAGNLKAFQGAEAFNAYAEGLRDFGYPFIPHMGFLWLARLLLLGAVGIHIMAAIQTWRQSVAARRQGYKKEQSLAFSYASRTMRWGGVIILAFVVYHILHFTTGQAHAEFIPGDAYHNLVSGFQSPLVVGAYVVAQIALGLHVYHGAWSALQSLGANHPRYNHLRRPAAAAVALIVIIGFLSVPAAVQMGVLTL